MEKQEKDAVIVFKDEIKQHPDFYMTIDKRIVQPWSKRWVELCIMKALMDLNVTIDNLAELQLSQIQKIVKENKIIEVSPPGYIPMDYVDHIYVRSANISEDVRKYLFENVETIKSENPLSDAYITMSRLQASDSDSFAMDVQNYSFGLDSFIKRFAIRNLWGSYKFVCNQKKVDLVVSFQGKETYKLKFIDKKKREGDEVSPKDKKVPLEGKRKEIVEIPVDTPEYGIEYVFSISDTFVRVECWEIFADDDGDDDGHGIKSSKLGDKKAIIYEDDKNIGFAPDYLKIGTGEIHANVKKKKFLITS